MFTLIFRLPNVLKYKRPPNNPAKVKAIDFRIKIELTGPSKTDRKVPINPMIIPNLSTCELMSVIPQEEIVVKAIMLPNALKIKMAETRLCKKKDRRIMTTTMAIRV